MTESQNIQDLLRANAEYVKNFPPENASLPMPPSNRLLIVTCMDARFHPPSAFGLALGSTHLVRNAGGKAQEALESIKVSQNKLGTNELLLIKHTDCGAYDGKGPEELGAAVVEDVNFLRENVGGSISGWLYDVKTGGVKRII